MYNKKMLPSSVSNYLPHTGLLLIFVGLIFAVIATMDATSTLSDSTLKDLSNQTKFSVLAYALISAGGFVLIGPFH